MNISIFPSAITKSGLFSLALLFVLFNSYGQIPTLEWQKCLGGTGYDNATGVVQTSDGNYVIAGSSGSANGDVTGNHGGSDFWIAKINTSGGIIWQKSYGSTYDDYAMAMVGTSDGGFIVAGSVGGDGGNVSGYHWGDDVWVIKLSSTGALQWQKTLGGSMNDNAYDVQQTSDGGYIIAGSNGSTDGDGPGGFGGDVDYWVVKLSSAGSLQWQRKFGGGDYDVASSVKQCFDGGYIVAGTSNSTTGQVVGVHGDTDYWIIKISSTGALEWKKAFGGTGADYAYSVIQTNDTGYVVAGNTSSTNTGDVSGLHGDTDVWLLKLTSAGNLQWQKCIGGNYDDYGLKVVPASGDGYAIAANSNSTDGDVSGIHGYLLDYWLVKVDASGAIQWSKMFGGTGIENAASVIQSADGGFVMVGYASNASGDVTGPHGDKDYWVTKISRDPNAPITGIEGSATATAISIAPNPTTGTITIAGAAQPNVRVYNTIGQCVTEATHTNTISIALLPAGLYFLRLFGDDGAMIAQAKVIKQ